MKLNITENEIKEQQLLWGNAVSREDISQLMNLYSENAFLKPTLSNDIRTNLEDIKEYFIGGEKFNDSGFLRKGISKVDFTESHFSLLGEIALNTGVYQFFKENELIASAHFSFVYKKFSSGSIKIMSQHSSLCL